MSINIHKPGYPDWIKFLFPIQNNAWIRSREGLLRKQVWHLGLDICPDPRRAIYRMECSPQREVQYIVTRFPDRLCVRCLKTVLAQKVLERMGV